MSGPKGITVDQIAAALRKTNGNRMEAAAILGCTRSSLSRRVQQNPKLCPPDVTLCAPARRPGKRDSEVTAALMAANGSHRTAAGLLGVTRGAVSVYIKRRPHVWPDGVASGDSQKAPIGFSITVIR